LLKADPFSVVATNSVATEKHREQLAAIDLAPVGDPRDDDAPLRIVDRVDDPMVADADTEIAATGEFDGAGRPRILGEAVDRRPYPFVRRSVKAPIGAGRDRVETNLVEPLRRSLLPNFCPRHRELGLITSLEGRKTVFEILEAIDELGVAVDVDEDARQPATLRDVERLVGVAERVEFPTETSA
jgi:hypothetical protein